MASISDRPVPALPEDGTLTFLLTDVEGSTPLWEQHEAAMRRAMTRHDALFASLVPEHGGVVVKERGEGDAIFAVFTDPVNAVRAGVAIQQALRDEPCQQDWPGHAISRHVAAGAQGEAARAAPLATPVAEPVPRASHTRSTLHARAAPQSARPRRRVPVSRRPCGVI